MTDTQARYSITPAGAWDDPELTHLQVRVLGLIGTYLGKDQTAWPSRGTLAERLNCSKKAITDATSALQKRGYLTIHERYRDDGGRSSNLYCVHLDPLHSEVDTTLTSKCSAPPQQGVDKNYTQLTIPNEESPDETVNQSVDAFWELTPKSRRTRTSKKKIKTEMAKLTLEKRRQVYRAYQRHLEHPDTKRDDYKYLKGLDRWLRDELYEGLLRDEPVLLNSQDEDPVSDLERCFQIYVQTGIWQGNRFGHTLKPDHENADYPADLMQRYGFGRAA